MSTAENTLTAILDINCASFMLFLHVRQSPEFYERSLTLPVDVREIVLEGRGCPGSPLSEPLKEMTRMAAERKKPLKRSLLIGSSDEVLE